MKTRTLIALAVIAGFAATAQAAGDKAASASRTGNAGADNMFNALDKNKDGFLSRDEVKGSPHDKDFVSLDKNKDGKLTPEEHASAKEHQADKAASGGTKAPSSGASSSGSSASGGSAPSSSQPKSKY